MMKILMIFQKAFMYGISYITKIKKIGNIFLDYHKYTDFENYFLAYSSSNTFFIYDYFVNNEDDHYSTFLETVLYKSNKKECVLNSKVLLH